MSVENLVILVEGKSEKVLLDTIVPKILPEGVSHQCISFEGKSDLMKNVAMKIRAWKKPNSVFLVMRDQDSGDCRAIKNQILEECVKSFRNSRDYLVRIACHELEAFYLGDVEAVKSAGFEISLSKKFKKGYSNPDAIANAKDELSKITGRNYQEITGTAAIAPFLKLDGSNNSTSFNMLVSGIAKLVAV